MKHNTKLNDHSAQSCRVISLSHILFLMTYNTNCIHTFVNLILCIKKTILFHAS